MISWQDVVSKLAARLDPAGFDVLGAATASAYNATLEDTLRDYRLPELGVGAALVLVIGNTRRLWPLFLQAYAATALHDEADPLDAYSRLHIAAAAADLGRELQLQHALRYSFDRAPNSVAIQRLAALAGVAEVAPIGLCVHPTHGPWFSLRAALVFDVLGPEPRAPEPTCSRCSARPCLAARERVIANSDAEFSRGVFEDNWADWLAMRDACPVGRASRYGDRQVRYHYLKERSLLREELGRV